MTYRVVDDLGLAVATADLDSAGRFTVRLPAVDEPGPAGAGDIVIGGRPLGEIVAEVEAAHDPVEHPSHYTSSPAACECGRRIECIDVVQHMPFNVGNAVKYLWRLGLKGDAVEDLRKARQYIDFEIERRSR